MVSRGESKKSEFYNFCVLQFMHLPLFVRIPAHLPFLYNLSGIPDCIDDSKKYE